VPAELGGLLLPYGVPPKELGREEGFDASEGGCRLVADEGTAPGHKDSTCPISLFRLVPLLKGLTSQSEDE
jgi:hypothetical protein